MHRGSQMYVKSVACNEFHVNRFYSDQHTEKKSIPPLPPSASMTCSGLLYLFTIAPWFGLHHVTGHDEPAEHMTRLEMCTKFCNHLLRTRKGCQHHRSVTELCCRVVNTPASYWGSKSRPGDRLSWLRFSWFSSVSIRKWRHSTFT
jgi:hypothetical protein